MRNTRRCGSEQDTKQRPKQAPGVVPGVTPEWMTPCFGFASLEKSLKNQELTKIDGGLASIESHAVYRINAYLLL